MLLRPSGGDDTAAVQAALDAAGTINLGLPGDTFQLSAPIYYSSNSTIAIAATLLFENPKGWPTTTFLFGSKGYLASPRTRSSNVTIDFSSGGKILGVSDKTPTSAGGQHGLAITFTDGFTVIEPWVQSVGNRNLFALLIRQSNSGTVTRGYLSHRTAYQGADGFHLVGNCSDIVIDGLATASGDDATSQTLENALNEQNSVIQRITYKNCSLLNYGHSSVKGLILAGVGNASIIQDIVYENCDMVTVPTSVGAGAPIWFENQIAAATCRRITVRGGKLRVLLLDPKQAVTGPLITLIGVSDFTLDGTDVEFFGRRVLSAINSPRVTFNPSAVRVTPGRTVSKPSTATPLISLSNCPNSVINSAHLVAAYPGQTLVSV